MTIDTRVFVKIVEDHKAAGIEATRKAMVQTYRFGGLPVGHVDGCAKDAYEAELKAVQCTK